MQAVILAGGKGTRLKPYTTILPKPLVPVGDLPILDIIIRQLRYYNIKDIIISTGYLAELIEAYFGKGEKWGVRISYLREDKSLGTAGAIKNIKNLNDNFIVMNGDTLTDLDYKKLFNFHFQHKAAASIGAVRREVVVDFGVLHIGGNNRLMRYLEKPKRFDYVSMGVNVLNKRCQKYIRSGEFLGFPDLISRMQKKGEKIYCFKNESYWLDIGRIDDFQRAQEEFSRNEKKLLHEK
jgi:NDP-sugar pyrophosphorylase family protein